MGKDPAMPFYVNDWLSSPRVQAMSPAQELAYFRLCAFCWASGDASIPDDDERLAAISRMGKGWLNGGSRVVRECFNQHPTKEHHLTNQRLYELWMERQEWREKSRLGGRHSAAKREQKRACDDSKGGSRVVQPNGNSSSSSSSSLLSNTHRSGRKEIANDFARWYAIYPKKVGKAQAAKAFAKALAHIAAERDDALAWLLDVTRLFAESPAGKAGVYTPHPASWLNGGRYDDDPQEWHRDANDKPMLAHALPFAN